ncbi:MAG: DUF2283 domain-containing protein [Desulfurococcaceae archaeon]
MEKEYIVKVSENIEISYDKQSDILYIYFNPDEQPDEEILGGNNDIVLGFKGKTLVVIQVIGLKSKIEEYTY